VELLRAKELLNIQSETIAELEKKLLAANKQRPFANALVSIAGLTYINSPFMPKEANISTYRLGHLQYQ
jgi:hypothetical protein